MLIDLAEELGHDDLSEQLTEALTNEQDHLVKVQTWLSERVMAMV
jgi:ferritin-like metal-binding protein YciE